MAEPHSDEEALVVEEDEWSGVDVADTIDIEERWLRSANPGLSDSEMEEVYEGGATRLIVQVQDLPMRSLRESLEHGDYINLAPRYQRRVVWNDSKRSRLIESLLINVPIPPVVLYEQKFAQYEVMDGQQRLETLRAFLSDELRLTGLKVWACINGRTYSELPPTIKDGIMRRSVMALLVLRESVKTDEAAGELRKSVFERLNTGAEKLNAQEIRNCIYAGPFNDLLENLARSPAFARTWDIPPWREKMSRRELDTLRGNRFFRRMLDNEIVLRFFALREGRHMRSSLRSTLDACMGAYSTAGPAEIRTLSEEFTFCLLSARALYGDGTFRLPTRAGKRRGLLSRPLYDAVMVGLFKALTAAGVLGDPRALDRMPAAADGVQAATRDLLSEVDAYEVIVGRPNTREATLRRLEMLEATFARAIEDLDD